MSTNSVAQGEHVSAMFPKIFNEGVEIGFAYTSFKWKNNAKDNAGVTVVIISLQNKSLKNKKLFFENHSIFNVNSINGYLIDSKNNTTVKKSSNSICDLPKCQNGSQPLGNSLLISEKYMKEILLQYPNSINLIKKTTGGKWSLQKEKRFCFVIEDRYLDEALQIKPIAKAIEEVRMLRKSSSKPAHKFNSFRHNNKPSLEIPKTSSENYPYIPMQFFDEDTVILENSFFIEDAPLWLFALLESKMHMAWIRTVCGQLETRIRYSSTLGYNTFPVPPLSQNIKQVLEDSAKEILFARENHTEKTLAQMYDPDKMPADLRKAHIANDLLVDKIYSDIGFENDEQRLTKLFELYEQMTRKDKK